MPPEIQSSTGILSLSFHTDMAVAKDGFSARYNMTHKEVSESKNKFNLPVSVFCYIKYARMHLNLLFSLLVAFHCSNAFGMESGKITDDQITASSSFYDKRWQPHQARLNYIDNAWTPTDDSIKEYIQVRACNE